MHRRQTPSPLVHLPPEPSPLRCSFVDNHLTCKGTSSSRLHGAVCYPQRQLPTPCPCCAIAFAMLGAAHGDSYLRRTAVALSPSWCCKLLLMATTPGEGTSFSVPPQAAASLALQFRRLRSPLLGYAPPPATSWTWSSATPMGRRPRGASRPVAVVRSHWVHHKR